MQMFSPVAVEQPFTDIADLVAVRSFLCSQHCISCGWYTDLQLHGISLACNISILSTSYCTQPAHCLFCISNAACTSNGPTFNPVQIAYNIDVVKTNVPEALEVLADAVLNPRFTTWEVAEQMEKIEQDIKSLKENPQTVLLEVNLNSTAGEQLCTSAGMQMCILMAFQCMLNVSSWHMTVQTPFKMCVIDCAAGGVVCTRQVWPCSIESRLHTAS